MQAVDSPVFDADNHYYEALDAFTRHLDPKLGPRVIEWVEVNGRQYHALGGRVSRAVTNPTFNPITPARRAGRLLPGQPRRPSHARADGQARADPARVPRPRRPSGHHGRPEPVEDLALPHARHALRGGAQARPGRGRPPVPRLQPLAGRGLGHGLRGPDLRRAVHHAGRRRRGRARAGVGAGPGRQGRGDAGRRTDHRWWPALSRRRRLRPVLGPGQRSRHHSGGPCR